MIDFNAKRAARAAKREGGNQPEPLCIGDDTFYVPCELPMTVVDRVLDPDMEIAQLLIVMLKTAQANIAAGKAEKAGGDLEIVLDVLASDAALPLRAVQAIKGAVADLFGEEQWARWLALNPSLEDNVELVIELVKLYGSRLGELFKSSAPAASGGATSSVTSSGSTGSTPEASGLALVNGGSSAHGG